MIFMRILPGVLKELLKHVPTVLFEAVEWRVLSHELPKLSRRIIQKEGYAELFERQKSYLSPFKINLVSQVAKNFDPQDKKLTAERILTLYFAQLFSPHGLFLDIGPTHLEMVGNELNFHPNGVWTKFSPEFADGITDIYDGFYTEDEKLFQLGLVKSGLSSAKWKDEEREALAQLFKSHFGASVSGEMTFELETFKQSFLKVADFMLEKKVKISTDFIYLGVALITMYSSLEKTNVSVNVKKVYLEVKKQLPSNA
jgi:predicted unusual protein kinase regulating ubiquinone biosynthesis (AarF/ABC1/UbiB family)